MYALVLLGRRRCAGVICVAGAALGALQPPPTSNHQPTTDHRPPTTDLQPTTTNHQLSAPVSGEVVNVGLSGPIMFFPTPTYLNRRLLKLLLLG